MIHIDRDCALVNTAWDVFLESDPFGEFQQSSMWARVKAGEGWSVERAVLSNEGEIIGGFQILWKKTRLGRIGYASRGPVLASSDPGHAEVLVTALKDAACRLCLVALIVQCANGNPGLERVLSERGLLPNRVQRIVTATWVTPFDGGIEAVTSRMRRETRAKWRKAVRRGVTVREGGADDLGVFFDLMLLTCERQGVSPNPASREAFERIWDVFSPGNHIRLGLAFHENEPVSAALTLRFGGKISIWKKGSNPGSLRHHPMEVLYRDAMEWGCGEGDALCDHGSLRQRTAEWLLDGEPLTDGMKSNRDFYNMRFGGYPELLPEARIWIRNPLFRLMYRWAACSALGTRLFRRFYEC